MNKLLIATTNQGKLNEFKLFLKDLPLELVSLKDLSITDSVEEDGQTYEENSQKKALFYAIRAGIPALADDAGLEIVALNGEPGVRSRRWLGYTATDEELLMHITKVAKELPDDNRQAFFKTVLSFALPDGTVTSVAGEIAGIVPKEPYKEVMKGYPYRSFFYLPQLGKYYQESVLTTDEQREYNHRYHAVQKLKPLLLSYYKT